jgi:hypothetical protein
MLAGYLALVIAAVFTGVGIGHLWRHISLGLSCRATSASASHSAIVSGITYSAPLSPARKSCCLSRDRFCSPHWQRASNPDHENSRGH